MEAIKEFRKLTDPEKRGGQIRRQILGYLIKYPKSTAYEIAGEVYGDPPGKYYKNVVHHLKKLFDVSKQLSATKYGALLYTEKRKVMKMYKDRDHKPRAKPRVMSRLIKLTDGGIQLCAAEGIETPSDRAYKFILALNHKLELPLEPSKIIKLRTLLSDRALDTLNKITRRCDEKYKEWNRIYCGNRAIRNARLEKIPNGFAPKSEIEKVLCPLWIYSVECTVEEKLYFPKNQALLETSYGEFLLETIKCVMPGLEKARFVALPTIPPDLKKNVRELAESIDEIIAEDSFLNKLQTSVKMIHMQYLRPIVGSLIEELEEDARFYE